MKYTVHVDGRAIELELDAERDVLLVRSGGKVHRVILDDQKTAVRTAFLDDRRVEFGWSRREDSYAILLEGVEYAVEVRDARAEMAAKFRREAAAETGETPVKAPIPGLVRKVHVQAGDAVKKDQTLLTLDAMKLENEIPSPRDGTVKAVAVQAGTPVEKGQLMVILG